MVVRLHCFATFFVGLLRMLRPPAGTFRKRPLADRASGALLVLALKSSGFKQAPSNITSEILGQWLEDYKKRAGDFK